MKGKRCKIGLVTDVRSYRDYSKEGCAEMIERRGLEGLDKDKKG